MIKFLVIVTILVPYNAPIIERSKIIEIALGIKFFSTFSATANLYWCVNAIATPIKKLAML